MKRFQALKWVIGLTALFAQGLSAQIAEHVSPSAEAQRTYRNPVIFADYSDPDAVRAGDDYYLVSSSFHNVPGLPILHSRDLVHWTIVGYAVDRLPSPDFDQPQRGSGLWAPSLRVHDGWFWIFVGDPDRGIFMTRARDPRGPWEPLTLIKSAKGWIDPCPLWDDDGSAYLVHAWAKSRAGFNGVLTVNRMSADGRQILDEGKTVFASDLHPTIEGPKFYKRNGWYYIFAPAGGVKTGWQTVLRSKNVYGPYEDKIVLDQGSTAINGPHQGAWVDAPDGSSWFLHFQDRGAYGRVVHLEPMTWLNEWPVIGDDRNGDGKGQPVLAHIVPPARAAADAEALQTSDEFNGATLGLQWQWEGNPSSKWWSLTGGTLRLIAVPNSPPSDLSSAANLLLQKLPAPAFTATTRIDGQALHIGERAGLVVMGAAYSGIAIERTDSGLIVTRIGTAQARAAMNGESITLRVSIAPEAICRFSYSNDGVEFKPLGGAFVARPGRWTGAKAGLFASGIATVSSGSASFDWFRIAPFDPAESASLVVAQDGTGDFTTIQDALAAIPDDNAINRTILIRNGTYREKVWIANSHVALVGEDRDRTRIEYAELRRNWRAAHPDDWGAAVINISDKSTDIVIANLTVHNDYGAKVDDHDHQFAIRSMDNANRIAVLNANVIADGGDTLSLWNSESGLSYYADSYFEGWVDYLCPRGWAYVTNSDFFGHNTTASIWHDGSKNVDQKFVIRNSRFDGVPLFALGRNHRDAQFYLLDVKFSANMADKPIAPSPAPDPRLWGERYYYSNAHRSGGDFAWFADNLRTAHGSPRSEDVTAAWTFRGSWDPETIPAVLPFAAIPRPETGWRWVDPAGVKLHWTAGRNARANRVHFGTSDPPPFVLELNENSFATGPLQPGAQYFWRIDTVTSDGIVPGPVWSFHVDARTIRVALAGDSTMTEKIGWGNGFKAQLDDDVAFLNLARSGRSSKSYAAEGHWKDLLLERPTFVLIQFGHNDMPGKGLARETDLPTFRANMARYVDDARAAGVKPVIVTPLTRRFFKDDGRIHSDLIAYADAAKQVATEKNVPLIDLHAKSIELLDRLGPAISASLGPLKTDGTLDKTHLNEAGSAMFGALMAQEVRRAVPELQSHIRDVATIPVPAVVWSVRMAESVMKRTPDPLWLDATDKPRWEYTPGLLMKAILEVAQRTGDERDWKYVQAYYDGMIGADGNIRDYRMEDFNLDRVNPGKPLFALYEKTHDEKYRKAIETLRQQLRTQPRTSEGGFWHKKRYPNQMWLDGLYMGAPFLAQYARVFNEPAAFDDAINQYVVMEKHARDDKTGLLYHGWDESRQQKWADPNTGHSPSFWGRAMGWYAMGLVDTLDFIPVNHPRRGELIAILQRLAEGIVRVQDPKSGVWWQVLDQGGRPGNYLEASVSTMFADALLKASRMGYVDAQYAKAGRRAYDGIIKQFVDIDPSGLVNLKNVCQVAGLGGDPEKETYRDGTYEYYVNEKIRTNDPKGVGPFIFASLEVERAAR